MTESLWLTEEELRKLTNRQRPAAQLRQLKSLNMLHAVRTRTDGSFVVLRSLIEGGKPSGKKSYTLNTDALSHVA